MNVGSGRLIKVTANTAHSCALPAISHEWGHNTEWLCNCGRLFLVVRRDAYNAPHWSFSHWYSICAEWPTKENAEKAHARNQAAHPA